MVPEKDSFFGIIQRSKFGPGAKGSGWIERSDFWYGPSPDGGSSQNYTIVLREGVGDEEGRRARSSVSHHDLWLGEWGILARLVDVAESPPNPVLRFDSDKFQVTSGRPLILTEDHIWLKDLDTRDSLDPTKVDGSRITFRVMGLAGGTLRARAAGTWDAIVSKGTVGSEYQEFTLRQLREGLISLLPDDGVSTLTFEIQAYDGTHLSDSDLSDNDADPVSVSIRVVALKEIYAGKEMPVSDDRRTTGGDGDLTPSDAILHAWMGTARGKLRVLVGLEGGRRGDTLFLEDGHGTDTITSSWSWDADTGIGTLSLRSEGLATVDDFRAVLNALALRTVRFASASVRTISLRPDIAEEVPQKDYYARDVLVPESGPRPYVSEQKTVFLQFGQDNRAILPPSLFVVEDFDTSASNITIVVRKSTSAATLPTLQKKDGDGKYTSITPESDDSLEFTLEDFQQGLIAVYLSSPGGKKVEFDLEARDDDGNWNDIGKSNTYQKGARSFSLYGVLEPAPGDVEVDLQTGYQKAVPFRGLEAAIETARSDSSRAGALRIVLENGVSGDRLLMRKSVSDITGAWSHQGHRYTLTVSDGATTSKKIDQALAEIYYRARESLMGNTRQLVISWVDDTNTETILFTFPLANRPPVLRNWGMVARYHDITPALDATETPLDLGYHPYREYMPEILDNEGEVVRLEVVLTDKAGGVLSADERLFLPQRLLDQVQAEGLVLRELRSSDGKARALVIEVGEGKTSTFPEFMSRVLQGLSYRHGPDGRTEDVGERRRISVAAFDGEAYSQTLEMEVRLVDTSPNPARYINTFIGTAKQVGMGVSSGTGNPDNEAGMTFPGAAYPFGAIRLTPDTGQGLAYGGYRHDKDTSNTRFVVTAFSGPGCFASEGGRFIVGVGGSETQDLDKNAQESEAGYYKAVLRGGGRQVVLEAAASSPRTATMRLTYQSDRLPGFIQVPVWASLSERNDRWVVTYATKEDGVCNGPDSTFLVAMHIGKHQASAVTKHNVSESSRDSKIEFVLKKDQRAVDIKVSMSYVSREGASRNIDAENPGWNDFAVEKEKAKKAWNYYLSKVAIDEFQDSGHDKGNAEDKWSIFYSALYRSMLHMNAASDVDGNYRGIGGRIKNLRDAPSYGYERDGGTEGPPPKVYFANFSGWDVYRSQMTLVGLMAPALSQDMAISLLESGYVNGRAGHGDREIPRWTTGVMETGVMTGDPGPPSVSSMFMFGSQSVSLSSMLEVFDRSSVHTRSSSGDAHHILEGAVSDAAIGQMALWMSQQDSLPHALRSKARSLYVHARAQTNRALNLLDWRGYAKAHSGGGAVGSPEGHNPLYTEGNSIQYTFMITHDVLGLKRKIDAGERRGRTFSRWLISSPWGGSGAYKSLLDASKQEGLTRWDAGERSMALRFLMHFLKPNEGHGSWYAFMGNEVAHSSPFLANWFEPHLTQNAARRVALFGFRNRAGGLYGNDDLGATSAWYVWTAMGIYPVMPGIGGVTLVAPMFRSVEISVPGGKSVQLRSSSGRAQDAYIQSVRRDGRETSSVWLTSSELSRGMELDFQVGADKSTWGEDASDSPPSYGNTESKVPAGYGSIWLEEGDDGTGGSSYSAFDGNRNTAWRFVSESDGSKVLEVDFTSVYAASGLLLRHADVSRTSTFGNGVTVSVAVKGADDSWSNVTVTRRDHDRRRMRLDFDNGEMEIRGLRLTFTGLDANEEHGIYEVLAKGGSVVEVGRLRSRRSLLEESLGDSVSWVRFSPNPVLSVGEVQATAGRVLVLGESHISVKDWDTWVPETGDVDASRITLRVRDVVGGALQRLVSGSTTTWELIPFEGTAGSRYQEFSLADLRADKIGFEAGDGTSPITFTIQAEDDDENLSDSDSVRSGYQSSSVRIPVVGLEELIGGETNSVNSDGALTPLEATLDLWRGAAGALTILVELHHGLRGEELLLGSHGVASITSSWRWDPKREIGTLSLEGDSTATALNFRAMLDVLQLRSAVGVSDSYRGILVRPDISGSAFRKDFHVREVKVSGNDAPEASKVPEQTVDEDATFTYQVPAFTDKEDDAAGKDLRYEVKLVVGGSEQDLPDDAWITFDKDARTFTFKPLATHVGSHTLRVRGTDSRGLSDYADFVVTVGEFNDVPIASSLVGRTVVEDVDSTYVFDAFEDEEEDKASRSLAYTAFWAARDSTGRDIVDGDGKKTFVPLPRWIVFDGSARRFTFKPDRSWHAGRYTLRVVGMDEGIGGDDATKKSAIAEFVLEVLDFNDAPVASTLKDHRLADAVVEDTPSSYVFDAFTDEEEDKSSRSLAYTAFWAEKDSAGRDIVDADGKQTFVSLPRWIVFDGSARRFTFKPDRSWHAGRYTLRVVGTEKGISGKLAAKSAIADFILEVLDFNDAPVASPLQDQQVDEDTIASYRFKAFTDEETPSSGLVYSAHLLVYPSSSSGEVLFEGSPASEEGSSGSEGSVRSRRVSSAHGSLPDWISFDGGQRLFRFSPKTGAHVGRHVLLVRGRDASGKTETADFTLHVSARNDAPEADVSIEGSLEEGRVVHLRVVGLSDEDGVPSSSRSHRYRWYESSEPEVHSSWSLISGAEGASFRLGSGQAGKYLRGVFSYTDSGGTRERVFAQSEEVVRRKSLPSVVVPIFGGEKESSSSSVSVSEEGEALEMVSRSLSQAQERLSLMRNRRGSGSGAWSFPPPRFSFPSVLSEPRVQPPGSQGSGPQVPQSPQAQGTTTQQSDGASSQPSSQPPCFQGSGAQVPQSPQAQGTSVQQSDGAPQQSETPSQSGAPARRISPSSRVPTRRPNLRKEPQRGARRTHRSKSWRRMRHPLPRPLSHERPTHTRTQSSEKTSEAPSCRPLCVSLPTTSIPRSRLSRTTRSTCNSRLRRAHRWKSPCEPLPRS